MQAQVVQLSFSALSKTLLLASGMSPASQSTEDTWADAAPSLTL